MRQDSDLASSFLLSLAVHLTVVLIAQAVIFSVRLQDLEGFAPLPILLLPPIIAADSGEGAPPPPARGIPQAPAPVAPPKVAEVARARPAPQKPARRTPIVSERTVVVPPPPVVASAPVPAPLEPQTQVPPAAAADVAGTSTAPGAGSNPRPGIAGGWELSGDGRYWQRRTVYGSGGHGTGGGRGRGRVISPDTPGYYGRLLGQVSVRSVKDRDSYYGRVFLFPKDGRDYSDRTLFGYNFRQNFPDGGFREFQVGRVQTHGAYLIVTDLYPDGRHSTMGHTVLLSFPRTSGPAFRVSEIGNGDFRLSGPGGSSLDFDGHSGQLIAARGYSVLPQGGTGTSPRVAFRGAYVRIQSVGGNPFLRGRPATVFDGHGGQCGLTTTDLFAQRGTNESDMFRFATDEAFYAFLNERCPWLDVPRPTRTQVAKAAQSAPARTSAAPSRSDARGLIPALLDAFR